VSLSSSSKVALWLRLTEKRKLNASLCLQASLKTRLLFQSILIFASGKSKNGNGPFGG